MKISSYKQMLAVVFTALFMFLSAAAVIIFFISENQTIKLFGGLFLLLALICFALIISCGRQAAKLKELFNWVPIYGVQHIGKIYGYEFDQKYKKSGRPMVVLDVLYFDCDGNLRLIKIPTDSTKVTAYPQGSNLAFKIYRSDAAIEGSTITPQSEREFEDMLRGVDIYKTHPQTGFHCPSCGAIINMPANMTARCPYCDNWLRVK